MKKDIYFTILLSLFFSFTQSFGQYKAIPDPNFEQALIDLGIDKDGIVNGQMATVDAVGVTGLDVSSRYIKNISGIEIFVDLVTLNCRKNLLTNIDLNHNTLLENLYCDENQLIVVNIENNLALKSLSCTKNAITKLSIDDKVLLTSLYCFGNKIINLNISQLNKLVILNCHTNQISKLDVDNSTELEYLYCSNNYISELNITKNTKLLGLYCWNNYLTKLNVSENKRLLYLYCANNKITSLNTNFNHDLENLSCYYNKIESLFLGENKKLWLLYCFGNRIEGLNLSQNVNLQELVCDFNRLTELNIRNGNNNSINLFSAIHNPNLSCIIVDDPLKIDSSWLKDTTAVFSKSCNINVIQLNKDKYYEVNDYKNTNNQQLFWQEFGDCYSDQIYKELNSTLDHLGNRLSVYPNPVRNYLFVSNASKQLTIVDVIGNLMVIKTDRPEVDVSGLTPGVYYLRSGDEVVRFVKW
ncbi:MAG: T9SS type A sorting domain-containing protein [Lewinellaceae bacterium]|nr:T9SS type A sorting domain-containing protein [Lewinellaceae bacterium]